MSITASLNNALSGLTAASRSAQVVSSNVSNAMTEGYARREIDLSARVVDGSGYGVQVDGVRRIIDQGLLRDRRLADAELGYSSGRADFLEKFTDILGAPDEASSISGRLRQFETSLLEAASRPDSDVRLATVLNAAQSLSSFLNRASDAIQAERLVADQTIADQVGRLNTALQQIQDLNTQISRLNGAGRDVSALEDQRQRVIDGIAGIVPIREVPRDDGRVSIYTTGGAILLDDTPRVLAFFPVNGITPDMSLASGALSEVTLDGEPLATTGQFAPLGGGSLAAAFEVRDALAPKAQTQLDALSRDLIERFEGPTVDGTLAPGAPGLFTDRGAALDPVMEGGLSSRLQVSDLVDPAQGGELRLLRDGLGAATAGPVGNPSQLLAFADALSLQRAPPSVAITTANRSIFGLAGDLTASAFGQLDVADRDVTFAASTRVSLAELEAAGGVDTDQELQKLLLIEQAYAANARVIQTVDSLIQTLLEI